MYRYLTVSNVAIYNEVTLYILYRLDVYIDKRNDYGDNFSSFHMLDYQMRGIGERMLLGV